MDVQVLSAANRWARHSSDESIDTTSPGTLQMNGLITNDSIDGIDGTIWNISGNVGLVSVGRIDKDTSPLTTPSHTSKSSAMDISSYIF